MFKFLIADDFPLFRRGVKDLLMEGFGSTVVGEASTMNEVLDQLRSQEWDALLLDIGMPGQHALDVLREVKRERPTLPVLILTMHPESSYAVRMFKAGADGYVRKNAAPTELVTALKRLLAGDTYVSHSAGERLLFEIQARGQRPRHERLTDREYQVLSSIASGKTITEIAEELSLSITTVSTYRARLLEKLDKKSNVELTRYAFQQGIAQ